MMGPTADWLAELMGIPFSDEQIAAITAPMAPGVIVAGAGTGKTTVMAARVVWLVSRGEVAPERVLGLTFTRKAAGELTSRVRAALALLGDDAAGYPQVSTYDSFAASLVAEFGAWAGHGGRARLLTDGESHILAEQVIRADPAGPTLLADASLPTLVRHTLGLESRLRAHLVDDETVRAYTDRFTAALDEAPTFRGRPYNLVTEARLTALERLELLGWCEELRAAKERLSAMDYADQMAVAVGLVEVMPEIGRAMRERFGLVVVDEFQDTSAAQARLLSRLFGAAGGIEGYPVTAVGDPLQAIYTWRGAAVDNIYSFGSLFPGGSPAPSPLTINRRSGPGILGIANAIATAVRADPLVGATAELRAGPGATASVVTIREFETWAEEADWIAEDLLAAHLDGQDWGGCAVLLRRNADIGPVVSACAARGIPVAAPDLGGLLSVGAVAQIYAVTRLLADPADNPAVVEILAGPRFRLGAADLGALGRRARELAKTRPDEPDGAPVPPRLLDAVLDPGGIAVSATGRRGLARLASDITALRSREAPLVDLVARISSRIGLDTELYASQSGAASYVRAFFGYVAGFAADHPEARLEALVAYLDAEAASSSGLAPPEPVAEDAVTIMTVHRAKGLEWESVYLPGLVEGVFPETSLRDNPLTSPAELPVALRSDAAALPGIGTLDKPGLEAHKDALREALALGEDRLAYVAVTRARAKLVLTSHRWGRSALRPRRRSRYLAAALETAPAGAVVELLPDETAGPPERVWAIDWPAGDDPKWAITARAVRETMAGRPRWPRGGLGPDDEAEIADWDDLAARLKREAAPAAVATVSLPSPLTTSQLAWLARDEAEFAARLARPLPRPPSRRARQGERFHAWVERYYALSPLPLVAPEPGEAAIAGLRDAFLASRFATARPAVVEASFVTTIAGQAVSGRIDAVFRADENPGLVGEGKQVLLVDWKTASGGGDPIQLRVYARAWAAERGVPLDQVAAGFFYVPTGVLQTVDVTSDTPGEILGRFAGDASARSGALEGGTTLSL